MVADASQLFQILRPDEIMLLKALKCKCALIMWVVRDGGSKRAGPGEQARRGSEAPRVSRATAPAWVVKPVEYRDLTQDGTSAIGRQRLVGVITLQRGEFEERCPFSLAKRGPGVPQGLEVEQEFSNTVRVLLDSCY